MDPQVSPKTSQPQIPSQPKPTLIQKFKSLSKKNKILISAGLILLILLVGTLIYFSNKKDTNQQTQNNNSSVSNGDFSPINVNPPKTAIAKVGDEYIFQEDLDVELANYPGNKNQETEKLLKDKLVKDSIILQAAKKENLASVSAEIFNSNLKNYGKRFQTLSDIEKNMNSKVDQISGTMVSVWFYNYKPAKIGLEQGKQEAFKRISALRQRVVNKEITMKQAGDIIKGDPSYDNLDFGYTNNAFINFTSEKGKRITLDSGYDEVLWRTSPGQVTEVYLAKTINEFSNELVEAFYVFGQVDGKVDNGNNKTFAQWIESQMTNYPVTFF